MRGRQPVDPLGTYAGGERGGRIVLATDMYTCQRGSSPPDRRKQWGGGSSAAAAGGGVANSIRIGGGLFGAVLVVDGMAIRAVKGLAAVSHRILCKGNYN